MAKEERRKTERRLLFEGRAEVGVQSIGGIRKMGQKNGKEQERSDRERERVKTRKRGGQSDWVASEIKVCLPQHKITPRYKDEDGYHAVQNQNGHRQRKKKKLYKSRAAFIFLRSRHEGMQKIIVAGTNGVQ